MHETTSRFRWRFKWPYLFGAIVILAISCGWFFWQVEIVRERKVVRTMLNERNLDMSGLPTIFPFREPPRVPWYRKLLGDSTTDTILLDGSVFSEAEIQRIKKAYPEVRFAIVNIATEEVE